MHDGGRPDGGMGSKMQGVGGVVQGVLVVTCKVLVVVHCWRCQAVFV
jgi:hypothetical protein